jgi:hypothetical protein
MRVVCLVIILFGAQAHEGAQNAGSTANQNIGGTWAGSYTSDGGGTNELSYMIKKDEKGQWTGTLKFANQDGVQTAEFKSLQIVDGKLKAKSAVRMDPLKSLSKECCEAMKWRVHILYRQVTPRRLSKKEPGK